MVIFWHWKLTFPFSRMESTCVWATFADFVLSPLNFKPRLRKPMRKKGRKGGRKKEKGKKQKSTWTYSQGVCIFLKIWWHMWRRELYHRAKMPKYHLGTYMLFLSVPGLQGPCLSYFAPRPTPLDYSVSNLVMLGNTVSRPPFSEWFWVRVA